MPAYLTLAEFQLKTLLPANVVADIEAATPGWTDEQLALVSARFDARLAKRYAVPFAAPYPQVLGEWIAAVVSMRAYLKRGVSALDEQFQEYKAQHDAALKELEEAANSEMGLWELPLRADNAASAVAQGFPRGYSEQSPYAAFDQQADIGRGEDSKRGGTFR